MLVSERFSVVANDENRGKYAVEEVGSKGRRSRESYQIEAEFSSLGSRGRLRRKRLIIFITKQRVEYKQFKWNHRTGGAR
jgi:hypothetical protein